MKVDLAFVPLLSLASIGGTTLSLGIEVLAPLLSVLLGLIVMYAVLQLPEPVDPDFEVDASSGKLKSRALFLRIFGPVIVYLGALISVLPLDRFREKTKKRLIQAGRPGGLTPDQFYAAKIVGMCLAILVGMFFDEELDAAPVFTFVFACLGLFYPGMWISGATLKRRRRIFRDLPDTLDMLRLATDAGLDLGSAMKVVVEKGRPGPLLDELELVEREMSLGRTRKEAFRNFADRLLMTEINAFVVALIQADQLGSSIGPLLKVQSEMARTRRWQLAEVLVNKMPMKMLGPLVVFIFPASFIILFTPLIIQYMQGQ